MLSTVMSEPSQLTCPSCTVTVLPLTVVLVTLPQVTGWCDVQEVIPRRRKDVQCVHFDHLLDESQNRRVQRSPDALRKLPGIGSDDSRS